MVYIYIIISCTVIHRLVSWVTKQENKCKQTATFQDKKPFLKNYEVTHFFEIYKLYILLTGIIHNTDTIILN